VNGTVNHNAEQISEGIEQNTRWRKCRNAIANLLRIPTEPLSQGRTNDVFLKLLQLDRIIVTGGYFQLDPDVRKIALTHVRRGLARYVPLVGKPVIEVIAVRALLIVRTLRS
jgi:hypothetical protein